MDNIKEIIGFVKLQLNAQLPNPVTGENLISTISRLVVEIATKLNIDPESKILLCNLCIFAAEEIPEVNYQNRTKLIDDFIVCLNQKWEMENSNYNHTTFRRPS